jgi:hypothetical protein
VDGSRIHDKITRSTAGYENGELVVLWLAPELAAFPETDINRAERAMKRMRWNNAKNSNRSALKASDGRELNFGWRHAFGKIIQFVIGVVGVSFAQRRREISVGHATKGVISEVRRIRLGIGDAGEIVFGIVGIRCDVVRRVGDACQPISIVIGVRCGLAVLVGYRGSPPTRIVVAYVVRLVLTLMRVRRANSAVPVFDLAHLMLQDTLRK